MRVTSSKAMVLNAAKARTPARGLGVCRQHQRRRHGDINDFYISAWNFVANTNDPMDDNGHGTNVSGIISAMGNNGAGVAGVTWQSPIMSLKFMDSTGNGTTANLLAALQYATQHGAKILNNSWGGVGNWPTLQTAIQNEAAAGEIFVVAAGNASTNIDPETP